jgi:hypothetical protein
MNYTSYRRPVVEDIARLLRRVERSGLPGKLTDTTCSSAPGTSVELGGWTEPGEGRERPFDISPTPV